MASEEINVKTVCEEPLVVIPHGLGYFNKDAVAELNKVLHEAGSRKSLEVVSASAPIVNLSALNILAHLWRLTYIGLHE